MAVRETIQIGNPVLKAKNKKVTDFNDPKLQQVIQDLKDSMNAAGLIGMAAPQIGENYQVFITEPRETNTRPKDQADELRIFINPKIVELSKKTVIIYEGCGSVLNGRLFGPVERPRQITVEAYDRNGKKFRFTADGILGRVIQHEYDHMVGIEFLEKVSDYKKMMTDTYYIEQIKGDSEHMDACKITVKKFELV
ncbi:MAG: peptide deformylase [Patescibacteria group bacterium]|nr:MAG: peptide deformylase [Patescibacteria group bacterium]